MPQSQEEFSKWFHTLDKERQAQLLKATRASIRHWRENEKTLAKGKELVSYEIYSSSCALCRSCEMGTSPVVDCNRCPLPRVHMKCGAGNSAWHAISYIFAYGNQLKEMPQAARIMRYELNRVARYIKAAMAAQAKA